MLLKFRTKYEKLEKPIFSNPGSELSDDYAYDYKKDGTKELKIVGHTNIQEKINSWKDYTSLALMVERFTEGDEEALNRVKGFYADMTDMPKTYMEMIERVEKCKEAFNSLDSDIKEKFDNNSDVFWAMYGTAEFNERLGRKADPVNQKMEEVIENVEHTE